MMWYHYFRGLFFIYGRPQATTHQIKKEQKENAPFSQKASFNFMS